MRRIVDALFEVLLAAVAVMSLLWLALVLLTGGR